MWKKTFILLLITALAGGIVGCNNFLEGDRLTDDPNRATEVPTENLFVGMQVSMYGVMEAHLNRTVMMWMQQMAGVSQHYSGYDLYDQTPAQFSAQWFDIYGGGGLVDMRILQERGKEEGKNILVGITKMWEALVISTAADLWGDVPYSEAVNSDIPFPKYDSQRSVHDAILGLIDEAIQDINAGQSQVIDIYDFTFAGDPDKWIPAAHTLKARILLNWAEADPGKYQEALSEARLGIAADADNWKTLHSSTSGEESVWWQFEVRRFGYVRAANFLVELLKADNDPRLAVYFGANEIDGGFTGSRPGEFQAAASFLNAETFGAPDWDFDLVSWFENQFIIAECLYASGDETGALSTLNDIIQPGLEVKFGLQAGSLPRYANLTGVDLLEAIMLEKYKAMFLNMQIFSDWRRTAFPIFTETPLDRRIPRRLLYSEDELNVNPNAKFLGLYTRVENDPDNPNYPGRKVND